VNSSGGGLRTKLYSTILLSDSIVKGNTATEGTGSGGGMYCGNNDIVRFVGRDNNVCSNFDGAGNLSPGLNCLSDCLVEGWIPTLRPGFGPPTYSKCPTNPKRTCDGCVDGAYGGNCTNVCHPCVPSGGACAGGLKGNGRCVCISGSGWTGSDCSICAKGWYGADCSLECTVCPKGTSCVDGTGGSGACTKQHNGKRAVIVGISVAFAIVLMLGLGVVFFISRRRGNQRAGYRFLSKVMGTLRRKVKPWFKSPNVKAGVGGGVSVQNVDSGLSDTVSVTTPLLSDGAFM